MHSILNHGLANNIFDYLAPEDLMNVKINKRYDVKAGAYQHKNKIYIVSGCELLFQKLNQAKELMHTIEQEIAQHEKCKNARSYVFKCAISLTNNVTIQLGDVFKKLYPPIAVAIEQDYKFMANKNRLLTEQNNVRQLQLQYTELTEERLLVELFGGQKAYDAIPVGDFITTTPIMKQRNGNIILQVAYIYREKLEVELVRIIKKDNASWKVDMPQGELKRFLFRGVDDYGLIDQGRINRKTYDKVKKFIADGKNNYGIYLCIPKNKTHFTWIAHSS